jgi:hypothetical protein
VTSGTDGAGSGTQVAPVVSVPVTVGGNAVSVVGDSESVTPTPVAPVAPATPTDVTDPAGPTAMVDTTVTFRASGQSAMPALSGQVSSPAALPVSELASTGTGTIEFGGLAGLLMLLAGAALMLTRRMNSGRMNV